MFLNKIYSVIKDISILNCNFNFSLKLEICLVFVGCLFGNLFFKFINIFLSINKWYDDDDSVEYWILINRVVFIF